MLPYAFTGLIICLPEGLSTASPKRGRRFLVLDPPLSSEPFIVGSSGLLMDLHTEEEQASETNSTEQLTHAPHFPLLPHFSK